jgi:hypothetical protein
MTTFIQRSAEDSPIVQRMLAEANGAEDIERALNYMDKVDAFRDSGMVTLTELPYEGPDLSPGADRGNCMKENGRGVKAKIYSPLYDSDGLKIEGRRVSPIPTAVDAEH